MVWWHVPNWAVFAIAVAGVLSLALIPVESEEGRPDDDNG